MPVKPIEVTPRAGQLPDPNRSGGGLYAELEVPGDYEIRLKDINEYDKRKEGKSHGWIFTYSCETPSGGSVDFDLYLSFADSARWKLYEVMEAHRPEELAEDVKSILNPNGLIGELVGGHIDFDRDKQGNAVNTYRGIQKVFALPDEDDLVLEVDEPIALDDVSDEPEAPEQI